MLAIDEAFRREYLFDFLLSNLAFLTLPEFGDESFLNYIRL